MRSDVEYNTESTNDVVDYSLQWLGIDQSMLMMDERTASDKQMLLKKNIEEEEKERIYHSGEKKGLPSTSNQQFS